MHVTLEHLNDTPAFVVRTPTQAGWDRAFGALRRGDAWVYPAYYPFGWWVAQDLPRVYDALGLDAAAGARVARLREENAEMERIERALEQGRHAEIPLPSGYRFRLDPFRHQSYGIARTLLRWRDFVLWEMGTGKTKTMVELLRILRARGELRRALVIAPPVVMPTWEREVERHSGGELRALLWVPKGKRTRARLMEEALRADVVVMSYARIRIEVIEHAAKAWTLANPDKVNAQRKARGEAPLDPAELAEMAEFVATDVLKQLDYDVFIPDESHHLGNFDSDQTRSGLKLSTKGTRRYLLTGTAGDRPDRLYPQLRCLSPALMNMSYEKFCERFLRYHPVRKYLVTGFKNLPLLNGIVDSVATRMKKADCLDLPPMTLQDVKIEPGQRQIARYNEIVAEMRASLEIDFRYLLNPEAFQDAEAMTQAMLNIPHGAARVTKLQQVASGFLLVGPDPAVCDTCLYQEDCVRKGIRPYTRRCRVAPAAPERVVVRDFGNPKLETFEYYLAQILDDDPTNKVICWGNFMPELDDMEAVCRKLKVGYVRIDGSNTSRVKTFEERFQQDPACRVWVSQVRAGVGITITAANYMIYYALPWDRKDYRQAMERNNRPGQTRPMTTYRFMVRDTLDEFVALVLEHKDLMAYTLTEKIACAACPHQLRCGREEIRPFRDGCVYEPNPQRPIAAVQLVREKRT